MRKLVLPLACSIAAASCTGARHLGSDHANVSLQRASIVTVSRPDFLVSQYPGLSATAESGALTVLKLELSSDTELLNYLGESGQRQVQMRCNVQGVDNRRRYEAFGVGPIQASTDLSRSRSDPGMTAQSQPDSKYKYTAYAFPELKAHDPVNDAGRPLSELSLSTQRFESLSCFFIGVTMSTFGSPRTNPVYVDHANFANALRAFKERE